MLFTLPHIIQNSSRLFPDQEAFRCGTHSVTYRDLDRNTDQLASYLVSKGVRKGDRIGVYMERCLESALAIYGIMKAGAAYVPLDPTAPHARTCFLLDDCGIKHLISTPKQRKKLPVILAQETDLESVVGIETELSVPTISWEAVFQNRSK